MTIHSELEKLHFSYAEGASSGSLLNLFAVCVGEIAECEYVAVWIVEDSRLASETLSSSLLDGVSRTDGADRLLNYLKQMGSKSIESIQCARTRLETLGETGIRNLLPRGIIHSSIFELKHGTQVVGLLVYGSRNKASSDLDVDRFADVTRLSQELFVLLERNQFAAWCRSVKHHGKLIGLSDSLARIETLTKRFAGAICPIFISGATGTGKELIARLIHFHSSRRLHPFVPINCGAFTSDDLLANELFGHVKGAFTGAGDRRSGKFEMARGGTIFLDEVACMSAAMQVALLRTLRYGEIQKVGDDTSVLKTDVRIITACNENLAEMVAKGTFREDVFSRLRVAHIHVPTLAERRSDIPILVHYLLNKIARETSLPRKHVTTAVMQRLASFEFPDNVAGLENCLYHAFLASDDDIREEALPGYLKERAAEKFSHDQSAPADPEAPVPLSQALACYEADYIRQVLKDMSGNVSQTARALGITRQGLQKKMRRLRGCESIHSDLSRLRGI